MLLVNKDFNTLLPDTDARVIKQFGLNVEQTRYYIINEVAIQAIGGGNISISFFGQDPTVYGAERVTV